MQVEALEVIVRADGLVHTHLWRYGCGFGETSLERLVLIERLPDPISEETPRTTSRLWPAAFLLFTVLAFTFVWSVLH
jgi:hypothetical protein